MSKRETTDAKAHAAAERVREAAAALNEAMRGAASVGIRTEIDTVLVQTIGAAPFALITVRTWLEA